jgi:hypothetical protein
MSPAARPFFLSYHHRHFGFQQEESHTSFGKATGKSRAGFVKTLSQANAGRGSRDWLFGTIAKATAWAYRLQEDGAERSEGAPLASRR